MPLFILLFLFCLIINFNYCYVFGFDEIVGKSGVSSIKPGYVGENLLKNEKCNIVDNNQIKTKSENDNSKDISWIKRGPCEWYCSKDEYNDKILFIKAVAPNGGGGEWKEACELYQYMEIDISKLDVIPSLASMPMLEGGGLLRNSNDKTFGEIVLECSKDLPSLKIHSEFYHYRATYTTVHYPDSGYSNSKSWAWMGWSHKYIQPFVYENECKPFGNGMRFVLRIAPYNSKIEKKYLAPFATYGNLSGKIKNYKDDEAAVHFKALWGSLHNQYPTESWLSRYDLTGPQFSPFDPDKHKEKYDLSWSGNQVDIWGRPLKDALTPAGKKTKTKKTKTKTKTKKNKKDEKEKEKEKDNKEKEKKENKEKEKKETEIKTKAIKVKSKNKTRTRTRKPKDPNADPCIGMPQWRCLHLIEPRESRWNIDTYADKKDRLKANDERGYYYIKIYFNYNILK